MRIGRTIGVALGTLVLALAGTPTPAGALAPTPGISPAAERVTHVSRYGFGDYDCRSGRACLAVWDDTTGDWKVFDLFRCGTYRLSYWYGQGGLKNHQTGGAVVRTFGDGGTPAGDYPPSLTRIYEPDWGPVWSVRPC